MKTIITSLSALILLFIMVSCDSNSSSKTTPLDNTEILQAKALFQTHCKACHGASGAENGRIAPPMIAIKMHYITEQTTEEEFISAVESFVTQPSVEKSKMPGAVKRFNLMVPMPVASEDLRKIAQYVYETDLEKPEWFKDHMQSEHPNGMGGEHPTNN